MDKNINFDYYIEKLMNHLYEQKLYKLSYKLNLNDIYKTNNEEINSLISRICEEDFSLPLDTEALVKDFINSYGDGYFVRRAVAVHKNFLYPFLYDTNGNPQDDVNYNRYMILLWESDMDDLYLEEVYARFNEKSFNSFVKDNFLSLVDNILSYIEYELARDENNKKISIRCNNKSEVLDTVKSMILDKSLGFEWAEFLVDLDSVRNEIWTFAGDLDIYSEYEKLEDDLGYCLNNHCKYTCEELLNVLINEKGFIWDDNVGLYIK